jgi:hypothetical protein
MANKSYETIDGMGEADMWVKMECMARNISVWNYGSKCLGLWCPFSPYTGNHRSVHRLDGSPLVTSFHYISYILFPIYRVQNGPLVLPQVRNSFFLLQNWTGLHLHPTPPKKVLLLVFVFGQRPRKYLISKKYLISNYGIWSKFTPLFF